MSTGAAVLRRNLVRRLREGPNSFSDRVLGAFAKVPRHLFLPDVAEETAYQDEPIVIKRDGDGRPISSSSQPSMMALMLDQLDLAPGHRVLEIGAGTGYNAALLAELVSPGGEVVSVDLDADLVARARENLKRAGYREVTVVCADGAHGWAERAPYHRIIATVGVWDLPPAWRTQLAPGGRIVVPLDLGGPQRSVAFDAVADHWVGRSAVPCGFMRLRGPFSGPERTEVIDRETDLRITLPRGGELDQKAMLAAFAEPPARQDLDLTIDPRQLFGALGLWLAVRGRRWCTISESATAPRPRLPRTLPKVSDRRVTAGFCTTDSLALFGVPTGATVIGYGPSGGELAAALAGEVRSWCAAGRPSDRAVRIDAFPASTSDNELAGRYTLDKVHTRLAVSFSPESSAER